MNATYYGKSFIILLQLIFISTLKVGIVNLNLQTPNLSQRL